MNKNLHSLTARMQRMRFRLQRYDVVVEHKPGSQMYLADTLIVPCAIKCQRWYRAVWRDPWSKRFTCQQGQTTRTAWRTANDPTLNKLHWALIGWNWAVSPAIRPYITFHHEISYEDGILFKANKIFKPIFLRSEMLQCIHASHSWKAKSRMRDYVLARYKCTNWGQSIQTFNVPRSAQNTNSRANDTSRYTKVTMMQGRNRLISIQRMQLCLMHQLLFEVPRHCLPTGHICQNCYCSIELQRLVDSEYHKTLWVNGPQYSSQYVSNVCWV